MKYTVKIVQGACFVFATVFALLGVSVVSAQTAVIGTQTQPLPPAPPAPSIPSVTNTQPSTIAPISIPDPRPTINKPSTFEMPSAPTPGTVPVPAPFSADASTSTTPNKPPVIPFPGQQGLTTALQASGGFARFLGAGSSHTDVASLQKFLNQNGYTVAEFGPGSPGNESRYFGNATKRALMNFQKANGITPTGTFGPITRKLVNTMMQ
jgi:hypothetical protein